MTSAKIAAGAVTASDIAASEPLKTAALRSYSCPDAPATTCRWDGPLQYYKDPIGIVHLDGSQLAFINSGLAFVDATGVRTTITNLPAGYRPAHEMEFSTGDLVDFDEFGRSPCLRIGTDGDISLCVTHGTGVGFSPNLVSFRAGG